MLGHYVATISQRSVLVSFNLFESGNAFLSVYDNKSERATTYLFDRDALKWAPLKGLVDSPRNSPYLIGIDGEQLVFRDWKSNAMFLSLSQ